MTRDPRAAGTPGPDRDACRCHTSDAAITAVSNPAAARTTVAGRTALRSSGTATMMPGRGRLPQSFPISAGPRRRGQRASWRGPHDRRECPDRAPAAHDRRRGRRGGQPLVPAGARRRQRAWRPRVRAAAGRRPARPLSCTGWRLASAPPSSPSPLAADSNFRRRSLNETAESLPPRHPRVPTSPGPVYGVGALARFRRLVDGQSLTSGGRQDAGDVAAAGVQALGDRCSRAPLKLRIGERLTVAPGHQFGRELRATASALNSGENGRRCCPIGTPSARHSLAGRVSTTRRRLNDAEPAAMLASAATHTAPGPRPGRSITAS